MKIPPKIGVKIPPKIAIGGPQIRIADTSKKLVMSPKIFIDPLEMRGKSVALLGVNGSGKSTSVRRMTEEHIRIGMPFTICDIENEYPLLKELGEVVIAGPATDMGKIKVDIRLTNSGQFHEMGMRAYLESLTVVLLLGDLDDETRKTFLKAYLDGIFEAATPDNKHYYRIFLEECQEYVPQSGIDKKDPLRLTILRFGKRGRKRYLSLGLISQRPSNVDKDVLTQCHSFLLHYVTYDTDIQIYEKALGIKDAAEKMKGMRPGDAIYLYGRDYIEDRINLPKTISPWEVQGEIDTSKFREVASEELQERIDQDLDDSGNSVVPTAYLHKMERYIPELEAKIKRLEETNGGLEVRIQELHARIPRSNGASAIDDAHNTIAILQEELRAAKTMAHPVHMIAELIRSSLPTAEGKPNGKTEQVQTGREDKPIRRGPTKYNSR